MRPTAGDWECIPTTNRSYGYNKLDHNYKSAAFFIRLLAKTAAKGGNMLLNIGPMGNGQIDPNATEILLGIGRWMAINGDSIHATQRTPLDRQAWGDSTVNGSTIYLHVFNWPTDGRLVVGGLQSDVSSAHLLCDPQKTPLKFARLNQNDLLVQLPVQDKPPDSVDTVVALQSSEPIKAAPGYLLASNLADNSLLAFDGAANGKGFRYGDGKAANYWVHGAGGPGRSISWNVRLNAPAEFEVSLVYSTDSAGDSGSYRVKLGDQTLTWKVRATGGTKDMQTAMLGVVRFAAGPQEIRIESDAGDDDPVNLFEIHLKPVAAPRRRPLHLNGLER